MYSFITKIIRSIATFTSSSVISQYVTRRIRSASRVDTRTRDFTVSSSSIVAKRFCKSFALIRLSNCTIRMFVCTDCKSTLNRGEFKFAIAKKTNYKSVSFTYISKMFG